MRVTEYKYLKALKTVKEYRAQVLNESLISMEIEVHDGGDLITDFDLPIRTINVLRAYFEYTPTLNTVVKMDRKQLLRCSNFGKASYDRLEVFISNLRVKKL